MSATFNCTSVPSFSSAAEAIGVAQVGIAVDAHMPALAAGEAAKHKEDCDCAECS